MGLAAWVELGGRELRALALSHTVVPPESSVTIWHAHRPVLADVRN